jgi:hypothetical protein
MLGWFKRKSYDKLVYAERLYMAFVDRQISKLTPERLHIQNGIWEQYEAKALFYREAWCICALSAVANSIYSLFLLSWMALFRQNARPAGYITRMTD